jgi:hypothetical protein
MSHAVSPRATLLVAMIIALAGCRGGLDRLACPLVGNSGRSPLECQPTEPDERVPDLSRLPPWSELPIRTEEATTWCALSEQAACHAAGRYSPAANMLDAEASNVRQQFLQRHHLAHQANTAEAVVRLLAQEQRNRSAAQALELHLRLAEVQEGKRNLDLSLSEIDEMKLDLQALIQQGIPTPVTPDELESQHLELLRQQFDLAGQARQINDHLAELMGEEPVASKQYWPELSLAVDYFELDHDELEALALSRRAELRALRLVASQPAEFSAQLAPLLLGQMIPGAGSNLATRPARLGNRQRTSSWEEQTRHGQVRQILIAREDAVRREVAEAGRGIEQSYPRLAWAARRLELARNQLESLEQQHALVSGAPFEVRRARLETYLLRQEVLHEVIEWKLYLVRLQEAQGLLAEGHSPSLTVK